MNPWWARLRRWGTPLLAACASAALLSLCARFEARWAWLLWISLVPWLLALGRAESWRSALWAGVALGASFTVSIVGWFPSVLEGYSGAPRVLCWIGFVLLAPLLQVQFITFALVLWHARRRGMGPVRTAFLGAFVYVATEYLFPKMFPDTLGYALADSSWLRQGADVAGVQGLTFVAVLANLCAAAVAKTLLAQRGRPSRLLLRPLAAMAALVLGTAGYGYARIQQVKARAARGPEIVVGVVQANITKYDRLAQESSTYDVVRTVLDTHYAMSDALIRDARADLLVWPETVYPTTFGAAKSEDGSDLDAEIRGYVTERAVPLIFGAYDTDGQSDYNAAVFLRPGESGSAHSSYRKTYLFPFTEWMPGPLDNAWVRQFLPWAGTWKRGPGPRAMPFQLRDGRPLMVAPIICYESIFPNHAAEEVRGGAELIITLSNDSWFEGTPAPRQHLWAAAFRSIETRTPQVRATNSGYSALIDATGEILAQTEFDKQVGLPMTVRRPERLTTLMVLWGDWLGPTALLGGLALLVVPVRRRKADGEPAPSR
ncbi:MAG TPA: apolipoprotein N-acyltransferase [Myxococcaceae bacterium]|nr:apolipoprotein N-acyltransferase [Myxococcaceae bacterium]